VGGEGAWRARPARLHPERDQQDAGRAVLAASGGRGTVSVPLTWDELDDPQLRPDRWTIRTVLDRLAEKGDPFRVLLGGAQQLPEL